MRVPILRQGDYLIATIQAELTDEDWLKLQEELSESVGKFRSSGVIVDVSALDVLDSFACRTLRAISGTTKMRGAQAVIVGIQPEVAFSMVQLGIGRLEGVETVLDLEEGLALLNEQTAGK